MKSSALKVIAGSPDRPLEINGIEIPCYVLEDETRVLSQAGFRQAVGLSRTPRARTGAFGGVDDLPDFLLARNLRPFISNGIEESTNPVFFQLTGTGSVAAGYDARLLRKVCEVYLNARAAGALHASQQHVAQRAQTLLIGLADVGIIALIDEATGYQEIRRKRALAEILEQFIAKELRAWTKTFPDEFFDHIFRLRGWNVLDGANRPGIMGHIINDIVYSRIAPSLLDELRRKNPVLLNGTRRNHHHQWLTEEIGHPKLREHLSGLIALMKISNDWHQFMYLVKKAFPSGNDQFGMFDDQYEIDAPPETGGETETDANP